MRPILNNKKGRKIPNRATLINIISIGASYKRLTDWELADLLGVTRRQVEYVRKVNGWVRKKKGPPARVRDGLRPSRIK
jgi:hypothetical protein